MIRFLFLSLLSICFFPNGGISQNPHLLVNQSDKGKILNKIKNHEWAQRIVTDMRSNVDPYVQRHQNDTAWILSRYLMNRIPGKRYTHAVSDSIGTQIISYSGDAPCPTVRYSPHKRPPVTKKGNRYKVPSIEELTPYDTSMKMELYNPDIEKNEKIDPRAYVGSINGKFHRLALKASILYWLYGEEKYAKFASDIVNQWARGAYYQDPIEGPCRVGYLNIQTLGDGHNEPLLLAYDFLKSFMVETGYNMNYYEVVFDRLAETLTYNGFAHSNWYAAESAALAMAILSLENQERKDYFMDFFFSRDTIENNCGHLSYATTVEEWLTPDGHWKEPGGYHNYPVSNLLLSAVVFEKNGYSVFQKYPALFQASYALLKYSFPNLKVSSFGDTKRVFQSPLGLELGLVYAKKYDDTNTLNIAKAIETLISDSLYSRETSGSLGLLTYASELPDTKGYELSWPRSGELDFARFYFQRNGIDKKNGLMYAVNGASYNHNHNNGMAMELYGNGTVMGADPGPGATYDHPDHVEYYAQWAAHNTVIAGGQSGSVPYKGKAGEKDIGAIELFAMEPSPGKSAVSENFSFTDTRYFEHSTNTNQLRTMGIIRTSDTSGYYIDIYRSDHPVRNDYIYHNIGKSVSMFTMDSNPLTLFSTPAYPLSGEDKPGIRFLKNVKHTRANKEAVKAQFVISENSYMNVYFPGGTSQEYYSGTFPRSNTAPNKLKKLPTPGLAIFRNGEAWSRPFVSIFEPSEQKSVSQITNVGILNKNSQSNHIVLEIEGTTHKKQIVFQGNDNIAKFRKDSMAFRGIFGVLNYVKNKPQKMYLGKGKSIQSGKYALSCNEEIGSIELQIMDENTFRINCNEGFEFEIQDTTFSNAVVLIEEEEQKLELKKEEEKVIIQIPPKSKGVIKLRE